MAWTERYSDSLWTGPLPFAIIPYMDTVQVNIRMDRALLDRIDRARDIVPRNPWLVRLLKQECQRIEDAQSIASTTD